MRLVSYCRNISMKMIHMNTVNSKKNAPHKFVFSLSQGLDFRSSNKYVTLQNIYLLHMGKYKAAVQKQ